MNTWSVVRPVLIVVIGVFAIHTIGRWEGRIDAREKEHDRQYNAFRSTAAAYSELRDAMVLLEDSLRTVDLLLEEQERLNNAVVMALDSTDVVEADSLEVVPLADLLPPLRLRFYHPREDAPLYVTDSSGVRFLAGRMLLLSQAQRRIGSLLTLADTRVSRLATLTRSVGTATARANTAEARLASSERIAAGCESLRRRQGKWLGFIPKPPPILVFVIGAGAGYVIGSR